MPDMPQVQLRRLLFLSVLTAGCAGGQLGTGLQGTTGGPEVRVDETIPSVILFSEASVETLWKVLPAAFQALEIPAGAIDPAALLYGNGRITETRVAGESTRDLFRCGSGSGLVLDQYRVQFGISAQPRRVPGGGAELFVQIEAFGRFVSASRSGTTHCVSNGKLELKIEEQMKAELARIGG
jgi:hypothetical protein